MGTTPINAKKVDDKIWKIFFGNEIGRACTTNRGEDECIWDIVGKSRKEESRNVLGNITWKTVEESEGKNYDEP